MYYDEQETFQKIKRICRANTERQFRSHLKQQELISNASKVGCIKNTFASKAAAQAWMRNTNAVPGGLDKQLITAYRCPHCDGWHTSSKERIHKSNRPWLAEVSHA